MKLVFLFLLLSKATMAQSDSVMIENDTVAVRAIVDQLFEGMYKGDSSLVSGVFSEEIRMHTTFSKPNGEKMCIEESLEEFLEAVGSPHDVVWDERISNIVIQIDGLLAQVWMDYEFYAGTTFSHCGANAMQMVKTKEGWKIINLIDTRRRINCQVTAPEE